MRVVLHQLGDHEADIRDGQLLIGRRATASSPGLLPVFHHSFQQGAQRLVLGTNAAFASSWSSATSNHANPLAFLQEAVGASQCVVSMLSAMK
jgi:hypothetical protein